jgi:hypothetical protein
MDDRGKFDIARYERMVKPPTMEQLLADAHSYPTMQSIIDQQMQDVQRAAIAEFKAKYGDKPYSCKWKQCADDPYRMVFTVVEIGVLGESEGNHG